VPVNSTHADYDAIAADWGRARDVIAGEDAVKAAGQKYLPRLDCQSEEEYAAYRGRASFFNATARTAEAYVGLVFRRPPAVETGEGAGAGEAGVAGAVGGASVGAFVRDADLLGSTLANYARGVVWEVLCVGRAGSLVDWDEVEDRAYVSLFKAEDIINWRVERVGGQNLATLVVLREEAPGVSAGDDGFRRERVEQIRVLRLVEDGSGCLGRPGGARGGKGKGARRRYQVDVWRRRAGSGGGEAEWELVETRVPLRRGRPLGTIPFVFHGPRHSRPGVDRLPLGDLIAVNLDHYRLDADLKHGLHFTALPTAWVSGFDKGSALRIGASTAWVSEVPGATAGFLEFNGEGLGAIERALDRDERLMAALGGRLLEVQRRAGEEGEVREAPLGGDAVVVGVARLAGSVSESLSEVLRWVYWWSSREAEPAEVGSGQVGVRLNTDFGVGGMSGQELQAVAMAWQAGAISQDTMFDLLRRREVMPSERTDEEEVRLIAEGPGRKMRAEVEAGAAAPQMAFPRVEPGPRMRH